MKRGRLWWAPALITRVREKALPLSGCANAKGLFSPWRCRSVFTLPLATLPNLRQWHQ
jgi:hypothetical protein